MIDIVLECFEQRLDDAVFFCFILKSMSATSIDICHLLAFKYSIYQVLLFIVVVLVFILQT